MVRWGVVIQIIRQMPIRSYSYRSMQACIPIDYRNAFKRIDKPLLVLLESEDEVLK